LARVFLPDGLGWRPNEQDQLAALGALMRSFGIYRLSDEVDGHWIISLIRNLIGCASYRRLLAKFRPKARQPFHVNGPEKDRQEVYTTGDHRRA
jgi:hypothetical protein